MEKGIWLWCKECGQCFQAGWDTGSGIPRFATACPYLNCDGNWDVLEWRRARRLRPDLPKTPLLNNVYRVNGWLWCGQCQRCFRYAMTDGVCPYKDCTPRLS